MNKGVKTTCRNPMYSHINDFTLQHLNTHSNKYHALCWSTRLCTLTNHHTKLSANHLGVQVNSGYVRRSASDRRYGS